MRSSLAAFPSLPSTRALAALVACLAMTATPTIAAVPWHADLALAKAASVISHRPVLIVFTAKWSEASVALDETTLANAEATALVTACFEPVKIDVDADPETTRRMGVSYLPTACVIDLEDRVLATFDCPDSPASFIAAAGRAAQDAATAKAAATAPALVPVASPAVATVRPRDRSEFTAATPAAQPAATPAVPATFAAEPSLPTQPPAAWPAETAATPSTITAPSPTATATVRPTLEPAATATTAATGVASWLGEQRAAPAPAAAPQPAPATAAAPATPPATPAPEEKPKQANPFIAAMQKPFAFLPKWPGTGTTAAPATPAAQSTATSPTVAGSPTDGDGSMPLGLEGYCPVTLVEKGSWVEGRAQFGARHRGRTYLFAGVDQQRTFLTDPDRYAPALSGDDPVMVFDSGRSMPGQRRYGVTYQSRIYLFSSPETRTAFTADPGKYTARVRLAETGPTTAATVQR